MNEDRGVLHVTNGDSMAGTLRAGFTGEVLPWRDVLHEGPVPAGLTPARLRRVRAGFIAGLAGEPVGRVAAEFADRDRRLADHAGELLLWFEADSASSTGTS